MNDTVVFGSASTSVEIAPSALMSVIAGGFQRYVSHKMPTVYLDGSPSRDPDFPESSEFR